MKTYLMLFLSISLIFADKAGAQTPTATAPTPTATGTGYTFTEAESPTVNPCITCVSIATSQRYVSGNISWSACSSGSTAKKYLNLRMITRGRDLRVRLLRDCGNPSRIQVIRCPGSAEGLNWAAFSNSVAFSFGAGGQILLVKVKADGSVEIELKAGWALYYDQQSCPG